MKKSITLMGPVIGELWFKATLSIDAFKRLGKLRDYVCKTNVYSIEDWNYSIDMFDDMPADPSEVDIIVGDGIGIHALGRYTPVEDRETLPLAIPMIRVMRYGFLWCGCVTSEGSDIDFETEEIRFTDVEKAFV